jgi:hypothetical protein
VAGKTVTHNVDKATAAEEDAPPEVGGEATVVSETGETQPQEEGGNAKEKVNETAAIAVAEVDDSFAEKEVGEMTSQMVRKLSKARPLGRTSKSQNSRWRGMHYRVSWSRKLPLFTGSKKSNIKKNRNKIDIEKIRTREASVNHAPQLLLPAAAFLLH